jgi:branched-chain amino acid transport system substrate-binding protein
MRKSTVMIMIAFLLAIAFGGQGIAGAAEPIKIGFMAPYVGVFTKIGTDLRDGFKLCLDEIKYNVAGREILFLNEDDEGKPEVGLVKARKLVEKDQIHVLSGIVSSAVAYAVKDYMIANKVPYVGCNAGANKLTQELRNPLIFRTNFANGQEELAAAWYAYAKMGAKKVVLMTSDYAAGHEKAVEFVKIFKIMGGEIVSEIYPPLDTTDFAPYLAKVSNFAGKADRMWSFFTGSDAVRFINQYDEYGLKEKLKIWVDGGTVDEAILPSEKNAALGVDNYQHYAFTLDTSENRRFVKAYQMKYNMDPGQVAEQGYVGAKVIVKALEAVGGKIENQEAFLKALRNVKFEAPRGLFRFDQHQNVIFNVYIRRVEKRDGKYVNTVIDTIPDVDQYWMPKK